MCGLPEEPRLHGKVFSFAIAQLHQYSSVSHNLTANPNPCQLCFPPLNAVSGAIMAARAD
ncbi:hypothetical protein EMEDMD4_10146 [Sinorhizobium medicae]|uniref:Uncharacterized protein n=1 Tax=Sinorhizobium medicae TaxID=110321 RepID=A0A508WND8_9HYPH|nr:hypothetical protein EMEDMD4_10146 [Sinorhizobium medicae]